MKLNFASIFEDFIKSNQKVWSHDRGLTVGASEVFGCLRANWFKKRSKDFMDAVLVGQNDDGVDVFETRPRYPVDEDDTESWGATKRGDLIEAHFVVPAVRDHLPGRAKLLFAGAGQQTLFVGHNSATPDGLIIGLDADALVDYGIEDIGSDCVMLEMKSIDPRVNLREEKSIHFGQVQIQMGIIRELTEHKPNFAVILYVDASFMDNIKVFIVKFDENEWRVAKDRAATVFEIDDPAEIRPEGKIDGTCEYCSYQRSCAFVTVGTMPAKEAKVSDEVVEGAHVLVLQRQEIQDQIKALSGELELKNYEIKDYLHDHGTKRIGVKGSWGVSHYSQKGRKGLNTKALIEAAVEAGLDIEPFQTEGNPFDVLRVTFTGVPDDNT